MIGASDITTSNSPSPIYKLIGVLVTDMATCPMCDGQMLTVDGCTSHKVLLDDGSVVDVPEHSVESSLMDGESRCHDCNAKPGEIHHAHCDSARKPDGSQILIDAKAYWDPETDSDPRSAESEYIFVVILEVDGDDYPQERKTLTSFNTLSNAETYVEGEDWGTMSIEVLRLQTEYTPK